MKRSPVTSSNVASVGYDGTNQTLEVEFNDGSIYQYFAVPDYVSEGLFVAWSRGESVGRYLNENVKKVGYRYAKL